MAVLEDDYVVDIPRHFGKGLHVVAQYHLRGLDGLPVPPDDRRITCECGWHGGESGFRLHRSGKGLKNRVGA